MGTYVLIAKISVRFGNMDAHRAKNSWPILKLGPYVNFLVMGLPFSANVNDVMTKEIFP